MCREVPDGSLDQAVYRQSFGLGKTAWDRGYPALRPITSVVQAAILR